ncbi:hypothetical protein DPEC_G00063830 [Dallia pectoralis]|uniref:Uncharacterized protein n=1 Tax=Dallia pectoralis TaxID=75939 RepID=A0ACC2H7H8_DALPE|nr:hypothetical protein DPEC_G00063830 [Dallia pectoralis]
MAAGVETLDLEVAQTQTTLGMLCVRRTASQRGGGGRNYIHCTRVLPYRFHRRYQSVITQVSVLLVAEPESADVVQSISLSA